MCYANSQTCLRCSGITHTFYGPGRCLLYNSPKAPYHLIIGLEKTHAKMQILSSSPKDPQRLSGQGKQPGIFYDIRH
jgi:hypothetical protein